MAQRMQPSSHRGFGPTSRRRRSTTSEKTTAAASRTPSGAAAGRRSSSCTRTTSRGRPRAHVPGRLPCSCLFTACCYPINCCVFWSLKGKRLFAASPTPSSTQLRSSRRLLTLAQARSSSRASSASENSCVPLTPTTVAPHVVDEMASEVEMKIALAGQKAGLVTAQPLMPPPPPTGRNLCPNCGARLEGTFCGQCAARGLSRGARSLAAPAAIPLTHPGCSAQFRLSYPVEPPRSPFSRVVGIPSRLEPLCSRRRPPTNTFLRTTCFKLARSRHASRNGNSVLRER